MVAWLGLVCLLAVLAVQVRVDSRIWGSTLTPGVLLTGGYTAIAAVYALATLVYKFNPIHAATYVFLVLAGLMTVGVSFLTSSLLSWDTRGGADVVPTGGKLRLVLLLVAAVYAFAAFRIAQASGGLWSSASAGALAKGAIGHLHVLLAFLLVWYAAGSGDRKLVRIMVIAPAWFVLSFYPVKGWTLIPMMAIVLAAMSRARPGKSNLGPLLGGAVVGVLVFFLIYATRLIAGGIGPDLLFVALKEITAHLVFYATAGFFGLDATLQGLQLQGGAGVLFAPFVNVISILTGNEYAKIISDIYVVGIIDGGNGGNVFSMYGSLIGYAGIFFGAFLAAMITSAMYIFRACAIRSRSSAWLGAANYFSAIFMFGWFEYYFWHLTPFEIVFYAAVVTACAACFKGIGTEPSYVSHPYQDPLP